MSLFLNFEYYPKIDANLLEISKSTDENLKSAQYFLVINFLSDLMYSNKNNSEIFNAFVIDESHIVLNDEKSLSMISRMIREARKFNTLIILGSQNITDFQSINNNTISSIFSNAANIFVGKIEGDQIESLNKLLETKLEALTEEEIKYFQKTRGNFLYFNEKQRVNFKVEFNDDIEEIILKEEQIQKIKEY